MLTGTACRKPKGAEKPYKLSDGGGMYLYILPSGYRSWRWKYHFGRKEKRLVFGPYPASTLVQARVLREDAARQLRSGVDPSIDKHRCMAAQTVRAGATLRWLAQDWMGHHFRHCGWNRAGG